MHKNASLWLARTLLYSHWIIWGDVFFVDLLSGLGLDSACCSATRLGVKKEGLEAGKIPFI